VELIRKYVEYIRKDKRQIQIRFYRSLWEKEEKRRTKRRENQ